MECRWEKGSFGRAGISRRGTNISRRWTNICRRGTREPFPGTGKWRRKTRGAISGDRDRAAAGAGAISADRDRAAAGAGAISADRERAAADAGTVSADGEMAAGDAGIISGCREMVAGDAENAPWDGFYSDGTRFYPVRDRFSPSFPSSCLGMPLSWKLRFPTRGCQGPCASRSCAVKQSFEDKCVPKQELGNEGRKIEWPLSSNSC